MGLTSLHQDGAEAIVFEVQGGFTWLLFTLTSPILSEAGLLLPEPVEETHVKKYNTRVHMWSLVPVACWPCYYAQAWGPCLFEGPGCH